LISLPSPAPRVLRPCDVCKGGLRCCQRALVGRHKTGCACVRGSRPLQSAQRTGHPMRFRCQPKQRLSTPPSCYFLHPVPWQEMQVFLPIPPQDMQAWFSMVGCITFLPKRKTYFIVDTIFRPAPPQKGHTCLPEPPQAAQGFFAGVRVISRPPSIGIGTLVASSQKISRRSALLATYLDLRRPLVIGLAGKSLDSARAILKNETGSVHAAKFSIDFRDSALRFGCWQALRVCFRGPGSKKESKSSQCDYGKSFHIGTSVEMFVRNTISLRGPFVKKGMAATLASRQC
jgi:hypothetical protein